MQGGGEPTTTTDPLPPRRRGPGYAHYDKDGVQVGGDNKGGSAANPHDPGPGFIRRGSNRGAMSEKQRHKDNLAKDEAASKAAKEKREKAKAEREAADAAKRAAEAAKAKAAKDEATAAKAAAAAKAKGFNWLRLVTAASWLVSAAAMATRFSGYCFNVEAGVAAAGSVVASGLGLGVILLDVPGAPWMRCYFLAWLSSALIDPDGSSTTILMKAMLAVAKALFDKYKDDDELNLFVGRHGRLKGIITKQILSEIIASITASLAGKGAPYHDGAALNFIMAIALAGMPFCLRMYITTGYNLVNNATSEAYSFTPLHEAGHLPVFWDLQTVFTGGHFYAALSTWMWNRYVKDNGLKPADLTARNVAIMARLKRLANDGAYAVELIGKLSKVRSVIPIEKKKTESQKEATGVVIELDLGEGDGAVEGVVEVIDASETGANPTPAQAEAATAAKTKADVAAAAAAKAKAAAAAKAKADAAAAAAAATQKETEEAAELADAVTKADKERAARAATEGTTGPKAGPPKTPAGKGVTYRPDAGRTGALGSGQGPNLAVAAILAAAALTKNVEAARTAGEAAAATWPGGFPSPASAAAEGGEEGGGGGGGGDATEAEGEAEEGEAETESEAEEGEAEAEAEAEADAEGGGGGGGGGGDLSAAAPQNVAGRTRSHAGTAGGNAAPEPPLADALKAAAKAKAKDKVEVKAMPKPKGKPKPKPPRPRAPSARIATAAAAAADAAAAPSVTVPAGAVAGGY